MTVVSKSPLLMHISGSLSGMICIELLCSVLTLCVCHWKRLETCKRNKQSHIVSLRIFTGSFVYISFKLFFFFFLAFEKHISWNYMLFTELIGPVDKVRLLFCRFSLLFSFSSFFLSFCSRKNVQVISTLT